MLFTEDKRNYHEKINLVKEKIKNADAVLIGAGAGLSTAAGFTYSGSRFEKYFSDFKEKYGFHDMYTGGFYDYKTPEENWAYWSRYIYINRYLDAPKNTYKNLLEIVKNKNYFIITTNVDHCFQKAGFDKNSLFYTQGDYGLFQCSEPCHDKTYDNENIIKQMYNQQSEMKIPSELVPKCPVCGKIMTMNLRADDKFVQDYGWYQAAKRYEKFLDEYIDSSIALIEIGVGYNTPGIIKYPFWRMTAENKKAFYAVINFDETLIPDEIKSQSVGINGDADKIILDILK